MNTSAHIARVYGLEAVAELTKLARSPQFLVPTLILPVGSFAGSAGLGAGGDPHALRTMMAAFSVMAALGPALFGFGAGVAVEREAGLLDLKRVSPLPPLAYLSAKLAACMTAAAVSIFAILVIGAIHHSGLVWWRWLVVVAAGASSAVPFTLVGMTIGLRLSAQAAMAASNVLLIAFTALGGILIPSNALPRWLAEVSEILPTVHFGRLALAALGQPGGGLGLMDLVAIVAFSSLAGAAAIGGWRRSVA